MKKLFLFTLVAILCAACDTDIQLQDYEDAPKVSEYIIGMTTQQGIAYLENQGFFFKGDVDSVALQYIFSMDPKFSEFSCDASIILAFSASDDTIYSVATVQRMATAQSARDLFFKWSKYTAKTTPLSSQKWQGRLWVKDSDQNQLLYYCSGEWVKQQIENTQKAYESGFISKQMYDQQMEIYSHTQEMYWSDYQEVGVNLDIAIENYSNAELNPAKKIDIFLYTSNERRSELHYETRDYSRLVNATELD